MTSAPVHVRCHACGACDALVAHLQRWRRVPGGFIETSYSCATCGSSLTVSAMPAAAVPPPKTEEQLRWEREENARDFDRLRAGSLATRWGL